MLAAQVFGVNRGFLCDCSGDVDVVAEGTCDAAVHEGHDGCGGEDHHHHEPVEDEIRSAKGSVSTLNVPTPVLLALLPYFDFPRSTEVHASYRKHKRHPLDAPPPGVALARTVALLI